MHCELISIFILALEFFILKIRLKGQIFIQNFGENRVKNQLDLGDFEKDFLVHQRFCLKIEEFEHDKLHTFALM